jgi:energy-converting hydrogenase Eha subunit H
MEDKLVTAAQNPEATQGITSDPRHLATTGPSFQCAVLLFVASLGFFIGAALLLASI